MRRLNCIVMGAAGRDFHDLQTFFRDHPGFRVRCITANQIPFIETRVFPRDLAGPGYAQDIPIHPEDELPELIRRYDVDFVFLAYSDLSHDEVMHKASRVQAAGASFVLLGPKHTELVSSRPVIAVTAVRTGAGKSPLSQAIARHLESRGERVGILRHPMPYGDLARQRVQRFASREDLDTHECTVEEREEYTPYIEQGLVVYAGVDYRAILREAERDATVILWDGGNNDLAFVRAGLSVVVLDALRPGHETRYYPGETNYRLADVLVINKVSAARPEDVDAMRARAARESPHADVITADLSVSADEPGRLRGRRVLVVEDGPTLTHGGMAFGAGTIAAREAGAGELIDPRTSAVGSIAEAFREYPHLGAVLPALGYSEAQRRELAETIARAKPDVVADASPAGLGDVIDVGVPAVRVRYRFEQVSGPSLLERVEGFVRGAR